MLVPVLRIVRGHYRIFFATFGFVLVVLTSIIFGLIKQQVTVQTTVRIGSSGMNDGQEPVTAPDVVVKMVTAVYVPSALLTLESNGTHPSALNSLRAMNVESIGRNVLLTNNVEASLANEAKTFQQLVAEETIREQVSRTDSVRERLTEQLAFVTEVRHRLEQDIASSTKLSAQLDNLSENIEKSTEPQRARLSTLYERSFSATDSDRVMIEAQIRELHDQLASKEKSAENLMVERSENTLALVDAQRRLESHTKALADTRRELSLVDKTEIIRAPIVMPAMTNARHLSLIFIALLISGLTAFAAVALYHNGTSTQKP